MVFIVKEAYWRRGRRLGNRCSERKEGQEKNGVLRCFQKRGSCRDKTETWNREEIPFSSRMHHIYIATRLTRLVIQRRLEPANGLVKWRFLRNPKGLLQKMLAW